MNASKERGDWWVARANKDGVGYLVRALTISPEHPALEGYRKLIKISYLYDGDRLGMPTSAQTVEKMEQFEDFLVEGIELSGIGIKTSSITGGGKRVLEYYTRDSNAFMSALTRSLPKTRRFPIELEEFDDENWTSIRKLNAVRRAKG